MASEFPQDNICHGGMANATGKFCWNEPTHTLLVAPDGGFVAKLCDDCLEWYEQMFARNARQAYAQKQEENSV